MHRGARWLGLFLGGLLVLAGVAETVRLVRSGDGGFLFWFPTLVGGGILILAGTVVLPKRPLLGVVLTGLGSLVGIVPTLWTLVVPVLLVVLVVAAGRRAAAEVGPGRTAG